MRLLLMSLPTKREARVKMFAAMAAILLIASAARAEDLVPTGTLRISTPKPEA